MDTRVAQALITLVGVFATQEAWYRNAAATAMASGWKGFKWLFKRNASKAASARKDVMSYLMKRGVAFTVGAVPDPADLGDGPAGWIASALATDGAVSAKLTSAYELANAQHEHDVKDQLRDPIARCVKQSGYLRVIGQRIAIIGGDARGMLELDRHIPSGRA